MIKSDPSADDGEADERLADALEQILRVGGEEASPSAEQLLASHPELAGDLESCLRAIAYLGSVGRAGTPRIRSAGESMRSAAQVLGDYRIVREIGRGGMGIVFEALEQSLGRRVALKVLPWATLLDGRQRDRFRNEARLAAQLHHTNIVPVFSIGTEEGIDYYAMQYIEGEPLAAWVTGQNCSRRESIDAVVSLGIQAADALAYAHRMGVIHRDIKPSNLLVDRAGKLWITDFGVARSQSPLGLTATGDRVGTVNYMSPEQYAGGPIDHRTDIYALGMTLRELLSLEPGVPENATGSHNPQPRGTKVRGLPRDLETILHKSTAPARRDRYPNVEGLAEDLRRFLHGEPIAAQRPGLVTIGAKWVLRHRRLAAASLVATLLTLAGLVVTTTLVLSQRLEAERQRDRAEHSLALYQTYQAVQHLDSGESVGLLELVQARRTAVHDPLLARGIESLWSRWHAVLEGRLHQVVGHTQPVVAVAFGPDGKLLATASVDATVALWDSDTGRQHGATLRHSHPVTAVCFSDKGDILASGDAQGVVRVWNIAEGRQLGPDRKQSGGAVRTLVFRPNSQTLASVTENSTFVRLWKTDNRTGPVDLEHERAVSRIAFVDHGNALAATAGQALYVWEVDSTQQRFPPLKNNHTLDVLCVSPDESLVAVGGPDKAAQVYRVRDGHRVAGPLRHSAMLVEMQFSPDGRRLAAASSDRLVRCWDTSTWQERGEPLRHPKRIVAIGFGPDSGMLVTASRDGAVRTWNVNSGAVSAPPFWHEAALRAIAVDRSTGRLATASDDTTARIWNLAVVARGKKLPHSAQVSALAVSADSKFLATGSSVGELTFWDLATREIRWQVSAHQELVRSVAISPGGTLVATASEDGFVRLWNAGDGERRSEQLRLPEEVHEIAFSSSGDDLMVACNDRSVSLWNLSTFKRRVLLRDAEAVRAMSVHPRGKLLACGGTGWYVNVLSLDPGAEPVAVLPHGDRIRSVRFAPGSGDFLAVGGIDGEVRLWNVPGFTRRGPSLEQGGSVYDIDIHRNASLLAAVIRDRTFVRLWDLTTEFDRDGVPLVRSDYPLSARFTPDGKQLITGWSDGLCWLWPIPELPTNLAEMESKSALVLGARLGADDCPAVIPWTEWQNLRKDSSSSHDAAAHARPIALE